MNEIGIYLKKLRKEQNFSLKKLAKELNTTDAILSRLEHSQLPKDICNIFKSLSSFYQINVVELYLKAGLISTNDLEQFNGSFLNCNLLSNEELNHVQREINFLIKNKNAISKRQRGVNYEI